MTSDPEPADEARKSVLGKVQLLLSAFHTGPLQMRLTELSRRSGVPKGTTYRLAQEMVRWGLLERVGDRYQIGVRMFELGQRVPIAAVLRAVSRPVLTDLYADTRASIHMAVLDGICVRYVEKITGSAHVVTHSDVGRHFPATCTSSGKVLLALHPDSERVCAELATTPFARMTSLSVGSWPDLRDQLDTIRRRGFALERQEAAAGFGSVAVPVAGPDGAVYAAVSAAQPLPQFHVDRLVPRLREAARGVSRAVHERLATAPGGFGPLTGPPD
ncbi:IclR family transcriptional regulator [Pseudonocardia sp. C8]|uniref:IclR family transcriptional regulator n=1 Tax=Pseudonocardia sp. C8 TaxID=2762759 RepID=UPI001642F2A4|nr:IclR family transcriptional regulator [Pseudonocardia sp. C8]MBC3191179.1 IclR family transcriptional regulator [Pseudonocardia sp. C8]